MRVVNKKVVVNSRFGLWNKYSSGVDMIYIAAFFFSFIHRNICFFYQVVYIITIIRIKD